jgi:hypothetical protein
MKNYMLWAIRILSLIAAVMLVVSFTMPWWIGAFSDTTGIQIYGWGLQHNLGRLSSYLINDITPTYQTILAWVYTGISAVIILLGMFVKRKTFALPQVVVGISYIVYTLIAMYIVIAKRLTAFGIALQGSSIPTGAVTAGIVVQSSIQPGFYIALAAGVLIIITAVIRLIFGKSAIRR